MDKQTRRLFFAVPIPAEFHSNILQANQLNKEGRLVRWVEPQNYHLTLKFIGDFPSDRIDALTHKVSETNFPKPSRLESKKWAVFPNARNPRVWVLQFSEDDILPEIVRIIDKICGEFGILCNIRNFKPHLTVGRTRRNANPQSLVELFLKTPLPEVYFFPYVIALYESNLTQDGAIYKPLQNFKL